MPRSLSSLMVAFGLSAVFLTAPLQAKDADPGAYLAARVAEANNDFRQSAQWYGAALRADPSNLGLMDGYLFAELNLGRLDAAASLAALANYQPGEDQLVDFALLTNAAFKEDYNALANELAKGRKIGPLFDALSLGWALIGQGKMTEALAQFDKAAKIRGLEALAMSHKALAMATAGDFEGAYAILSGATLGPVNLNRRGVMATVQILSQLERNQEALALLAEAFGQSSDPTLADLRARLTAGEMLPFDTVRNARDGVAEALFAVASLLGREGDQLFALMHSRIAMALRPDHTEALLLTASTLESLGQYDLAEEIYASFAKEDPAYVSAQIGRADALYAADRKPEALVALNALAAAYPQDLLVQASLGDMQRREENWPAAQAAYDAAEKLITKPEVVHSVLYFSRGISHERQGQFDQAYADFRRALELRPGQPMVLNYLGYSMLERGINLDEAFSLVQQAIAADPESGYIIDSLAWGYFMLGRYEEALAPMERASLLEPVDPTVTDHLGDVYWMNGREREARFQWHRALSFDPDEKMAERIRRKLLIGLDQVMAEEKAKK